eukprot:599975-Pelagomonas_calceolata.AAC.5
MYTGMSASMVMKCHEHKLLYQMRAALPCLHAPVPGLLDQAPGVNTKQQTLAGAGGLLSLIIHDAPAQ